MQDRQQDPPEDPTPREGASATGIPRVVLVVAISLGVLLAAGVATIGVIGGQMRAEHQQAVEAEQRARRTGPLAIPPVPAPEAASPACDEVLSALPERLRIHGDPVGRRPLVEPAPEATVAWGDAGHDPVTLRCGISAPAELKPTSRLVTISGVSWLPISQAGKTTWLAVDRPVFVAMTMPKDAGSGPVQELSGILRETLPKEDVFP